MKKIILCLILIFALAGKGWGEEKKSEKDKVLKDEPKNYLCIAELSTGFAFDKTSNKWRITKFNVDDDKYTISNNVKTLWTVKKLGIKYHKYYCKDDFTEDGLLLCETFFGSELGTFKMSKKHLRFMEIYPFGTVHTSKTSKEKNTPHMTMGKCSPL